ncbi:MAG: caspase family protein [Thainema sp.]
MKRRHFLQFAGSTLATIGLSQLDFLRQANQYGRVLAQGVPNRKLALLVGINSYEAAGTSSLGGCLNDVELQRQLLIHRFGFNPSDILEVSDNSNIKPTRDNILQAFNEHLIQQANPGDVVVFHYSGHGDLVEDVRAIDTAECRRTKDCNLNGTIVPNDSIASDSGDGIVVPDITGRTLFLLMSQLETDNVTAILDSCHSGAGTRGSAVVRAASRLRGAADVLLPSEAEKEYQEQLINDLRWSEDELNRLRSAGVAKGVAIGSALRDQLAVDAQFSGFKAGGFTYLLTRYLWQQPVTETNATVYNDMKLSTRSLSQSQRDADQVPIFEYAPNSNHAQQPMYFTPLVGTAAEAVITSATNAEQIQFWLGGVSSQNLNGNGISTVFTGIGDQAEIQIEQTGRRGLYGEGRLIAGSIDAVQPGMLLREQVIGISPNPVLTIGLDGSLGDAVQQAESDLQSVGRIQIVPIEQLTDTGYIFGRMTESYHQAFSAAGETDLPFINTVGIFTADQRPLSDTFGRIDEPVTAAINRLRPNFKSLLAKQMLGQITTGESSQLQVRAKVFNADNPSQGVEVATRSARSAGSAHSVEIPQFASGTTLKVEVENFEDNALFLSVLVIGADGSLNVLYPGDWSAPEEAARIDAQGKVTVPRPQDTTLFQVQGSGGFPEILLLVSTQPLRNALRGMQTIARGRGQERGAMDLRGDEPVTVLDFLLGDVDETTRTTATGTIAALSMADQSVVSFYDTNTLATLSAVIQVGG